MHYDDNKLMSSWIYAETSTMNINSHEISHKTWIMFRNMYAKKRVMDLCCLFSHRYSAKLKTRYCVVFCTIWMNRKSTKSDCWGTKNRKKWQCQARLSNIFFFNFIVKKFLSFSVKYLKESRTAQHGRISTIIPHISLF